MVRRDESQETQDTKQRIHGRRFVHSSHLERRALARYPICFLLQYLGRVYRGMKLAQLVLR